ncbi:MAG: hypothetical protein ACE5IY_17490 [bacterium]
MKVRHVLVLALVGLVAVPGFLHAQTNFNGGLGLVYVQSAWNLERGVFTLSNNTRIFGKSANFPGESPLMIWNISGRISLNYGLGKHFEVSATPIIYQDTNQSGEKVNSPDDIFLTLKMGSFTSPTSSFTYGFSVSTRIPTGDKRNVPFEPYSSNRIGWGMTGLLSYSMDPLYPEHAPNFHINLGYWNHNDVGTEVVEGGDISTRPQSMTQELLYGVGVKVPKDVFDFSLGLYGNAFLQSPPRAAYSRENYLYVSPAVHYKPLKWMTFNVGVDVRVSKATDKTFYATDGTGAKRTLPGGQPNYPAWRINFGTSFSLQPSSSYRARERELLMQKAESRRDLFEQIIAEQRETESAEAELERIRAERVRAERELERLRAILEGEAQRARDENEDY